MRRINKILIASLVMTGSCFGSAISNVTSSGYSVLTNGSLSTDNGVSIGGNVFANSIWLSNNTSIDGNVISNSISTGNNVSISGDLSYNNSFWMPKTSNVTGEIAKDSWNASKIDKVQTSYGNKSLYYSKNSTVNLAAGDYSSLSVSKGSTVYLTGGTYNFKNAWFDSNVNIVVDTSAGDVFINTADSFTTSQQVSLITNGSGNAYIQSAGSFYIDHHNQIAASILANTNGSVSHSTAISGIVYANNSLWFGNNVDISGIINTSTSSAVPEPATALLLISAIPFLKHRRNISNAK